MRRLILRIYINNTFIGKFILYRWHCLYFVYKIEFNGLTCYIFPYKKSSGVTMSKNMEKSYIYYCNIVLYLYNFIITITKLTINDIYLYAQIIYKYHIFFLIEYKYIYTILAKLSVCVSVCVSIRISRTRDPFSVRKTTGDKVGQRGFNR